MAVRFDAVADRLLRTANVIDYNAVYTVCCWVNLTTNSASDQAIFFLGANDGFQNYDEWGCTGASPTFQCTIDSSAIATSQVTGSVMTAGTWYHFAAVRTSVTQVLVYIDGVVDITNNHGSVAGRTAATRQEFGGAESTNGDTFNGRVFAMKAWSTNLSVAEINQERFTILPCRWESLVGWWSGFPGSGERARDYSGLARNFTESGTLTDEDPPPVAYGGSGILEPFRTAAKSKPRLQPRWRFIRMR